MQYVKYTSSLVDDVMIAHNNHDLSTRIRRMFKMTHPRMHGAKFGIIGCVVFVCRHSAMNCYAIVDVMTSPSLAQSPIATPNS